MFEGIAKTDTTYTAGVGIVYFGLFEGIAKTDTTYTPFLILPLVACLRVLLKQTQLTLRFFDSD